MKSLFVLTISLLLPSSFAMDGLTTSMEPQPPYAPGTRVTVRVSGPGLANLQDHAHPQLVGRGQTDFLQSDSIRTQGNPPAFVWTFTAPKFANTESPTLRMSVTAKNGVEYDLTANNTPAFAPQFTGITIDRDPPRVSNMQFTRTSPGTIRVEYDAEDPAGVSSAGSGLWIGRESHLFGLIESGGEAHATSYQECQGGPEKYRCVLTANVPSGSEGRVDVSMHLTDGAGNRTDITEAFQLERMAEMESDPPSTNGPARVAVCGDGTIQTSFELAGGGGGLFDGTMNIWSDNAIAADSSWGIASQGEFSCTGRNCFAIMEAPELVNLEAGSLTAQVGGESSGSSVGGVRAGNYFKITLDGLNGKRTELEYPQSVVNQLTAPVEPQKCNLFDLTQSEAKSRGTVDQGTEGTR